MTDTFRVGDSLDHDSPNVRLLAAPIDPVIWFGHTSISATTIGVATQGGLLLIDGDDVQTVDVGTRWVNGVATADLPVGRVVAVATDDGVVGILAGDARAHPFRLPAVDVRPTRVCIVPTDEEAVDLVWGDERGRIHAVEIRNGHATNSRRRRQAHRKSVSELVPTRLVNGTPVVVSGSDDREVQVLTLDLEPVGEPLAVAGWVEEVRPLCDDAGLAAIAVVDRVGMSIYRCQSLLQRVRGKAVAPLAIGSGTAGVPDVAFPTDDRLVMWNASDDRLTEWPVVGAPIAGASLVGPSGSGRVLYGAGNRLWDCEHDNPPRVIAGPLPAQIVMWADYSALDGAVMLLADQSLWEVRW